MQPLTTRKRNLTIALALSVPLAAFSASCGTEQTSAKSTSAEIADSSTTTQSLDAAHGHADRLAEAIQATPFVEGINAPPVSMEWLTQSGHSIVVGTILEATIGAPVEYETASLVCEEAEESHPVDNVSGRSPSRP